MFTFRSCSILVAILNASFRQAVPIFRFVSIVLISVGSALSVFPETTSTRLAPRRAGGGGRLGMNGIDSRCCAAAVTQITSLGDELSWRSALGRSQWILLTDTNNISKPPFRSCSILVPIRYASFRQAVPIFRFVSIFLIKNAGSELSVQYIQRHVDKLAPRWVGRRRSAARHRLSMSWSCYDDDQLSCCSVFTEIGSRRSRTDQRIGDGGRCMEHISRCVVVVS